MLNSFIIILLVILVVLYIIKSKEGFSVCEQYGGNYNMCYANNDCTITLDLNGVPFCTKKFLYESV
jgi:hypothetical protein